MREKIAQIGIEIEGEWSIPMRQALRQFGSIKGDGSLHHCNSDKCQALDLYEFVSKPFPVTKVKHLLKVFQTISKMNEDNHHYHWNNYAGFHIHVSFTSPGKPHQIWTPQFANFFKKQLEEKLPAVYEKRASNSFCKVVDFKEKELAYIDAGANRYTFINFGGAWARHKTIEFRIFPSDNPEKMAEYLLFTIQTINKFLASTNKLLRIKVEEELKKEDKGIFEWNDKIRKNNNDFKIMDFVTANQARTRYNAVTPNLIAVKQLMNLIESIRPTSEKYVDLSEFKFQNIAFGEGEKKEKINPDRVSDYVILEGLQRKFGRWIT